MFPARLHILYRPKSNMAALLKVLQIIRNRSNIPHQLICKSKLNSSFQQYHRLDDKYIGNLPQITQFISLCCEAFFAKSNQEISHTSTESDTPDTNWKNTIKQL